MNIRVIEAGKDHKAVLRRLMELYIYDFTEFIDLDVNEHGLFEYNYLDYYWIEDGRNPFLIQHKDKWAGFALVREEAGNYQMAEFFIMKKYRKLGAGRHAAYYLFDRFQGPWEVSEIEKNLPAQTFWRKIIDAYTNGDYKEIREENRPIQLFNSSLVDK